MAQLFKLKKGEILFENDKIVITDDAKRQKLLTLSMSGMWIVYGVISVLRYLKTGDQFLLWTGLLIGIAHFVVFIISLSRTAKSEISINEIKSIKTGKKIENKYLDIRLRNRMLRRIIHVDNLEELDNYIKANLKSK